MFSNFVGSRARIRALPTVFPCTRFFTKEVSAVASSAAARDPTVELCTLPVKQGSLTEKVVAVNPDDASLKVDQTKKALHSRRAPEKNIDWKLQDHSDEEMLPEIKDLFNTLRGEALRRLDEFAPIHLFSFAWAYSTSGLYDDELRKQVTDAAIRLGQKLDVDPPRRFTKRRKKQATKDARRKNIEGKDNKATRRETQGKDRKRAQRSWPKTGPERRAQPKVLGEREHWLAFYKPPYWVCAAESLRGVNRGTAMPFEDRVDDDEEVFDGQAKRPQMHHWVRHHFANRYPICNDGLDAFGLLHRLDAQTSGILLCAKSYVGYYWLRLQWCSYVVEKEYVCLVHGWVDRDIREVNQRIKVVKRKLSRGHNRSNHGVVSEAGKPSYTELYTLAHLIRKPKEDLRTIMMQFSEESSNPSKEQPVQKERYSLVGVKLHTGRTHQIRVHMHWLGHPPVCDIKYTPKQFPSDRTWCPRNFLHAYRVSVEDVPSRAGKHGKEAGGQSAGGNGAAKMVEIYCPLPEDLCSALAHLEPADEDSKSSYETWTSGDSRKLRRFDDYAAVGRHQHTKKEIQQTC